MVCRLCGEHKALCESHVIPEFFYSGAYDENHRALQLARDTGEERLIQKGLREPLLCVACEGRLSKVEAVFKRQWYDDGRLPERLEHATHSVSGLDYRNTRLLHLSILWRASVSRLPMFRNVALGPHEERIRRMLLEGRAGEPHEYHWVGQVLVLDDRVLHGFIMEPVVGKNAGRTVYTFTYGGCAWFFIVSGAPLTDWLPLALTEQGTQVLGRTQVTKDRLFADFIVDVLRQQQGR